MHDEATFFANEAVGFFWGEPMDAVGGGVAGGGGGADDAEAAPRSTPPPARTFVATGPALSPGVSRRACRTRYGCDCQGG
jgi:hypothetical protein